MNKWKKWGRADGFTLVELIVVIAILAILGGVAVPAYSGYVQKAEYAADEALLAELNMAFASACAVNGEDHYNRQSVTATITSGIADVTADNGNAIDTAFDNFYEGGTFKKITALKYHGYLGGFRDANSKEIFADPALVGKYTGSGYNNLETSYLTGQLDHLTSKLVDLEYWGYLASDEGFRTELANLDVDVSKYYDADGNFIATNMTDADKNVFANASALYVASVAKDLASDELVSAIQNDSLKQTLESKGYSTNAAKFVDAAMKYGLAASYYNNTGIQDDKDWFEEQSQAISKPADIDALYEDTWFQNEYLTDDDQVAADVDGLLAALELVNNNTGALTGSADLSSDDFFGNFNDIINDVLGK